MDTEGVIQLLILVVLLVLSAFYSGAETALTTASEIKLTTLADEGNKKAKRVLMLLDKKSKMLSAILIMNNIVNIAASSLVTAMALRLWKQAYVALAAGVLTLLILIFGEIMPKTIATIHNEGLALAFSGPIMLTMKLLTPVIFIIDKISRMFLKILRIDPDQAKSVLTEGEIRNILDASHEEGVIETGEREMIDNVFDFGDSLAKDVMIPRIEMTCVNVDANYWELKEQFEVHKYTRIPVFEESTDNIIGIVNMKDVLFYEDVNNFNIRNIMREANFTVEYKKTSELMMEMRQNHISMTLVLDEYGDTVGLVTLEDLLEEIVGEIRDEFDEDEEDLIQEVGEREYLVDGSLKIDDINDALSLELNSENYDSIGGLMIEKLERVPEVGESVELDDGTRLTTVDMDKNHIERIRMELPEKEPENEEESPEEAPDGENEQEV
ncbi:MAG: CNNM domain-containing protein [Lachnospiraceae bacterium]|nr:CNNM domain-containing protein [Lachnospiraceae bacterium]